MKNNRNKKEDKKFYGDLFRASLRELGDDLRKARLRHNLTIEDVYWATNISIQHIDLVESGKRFNIEILRQLAKFYHMNVKMGLVEIKE